eukprot:329016-Hanusia_phi.AAC.1
MRGYVTPLGQIGAKDGGRVGLEMSKEERSEEKDQQPQQQQSSGCFLTGVMDVDGSNNITDERYSLDETPQTVLPRSTALSCALYPQLRSSRCAKLLGMKRGVLAVRKGSKGSYVWDSEDPGRILVVPALQVPVIDPTGAGNAYSAAFGVNLARLLRSRRVSRRMAIMISACRATATGGAFVASKGMPAVKKSTQEWLEREARSLLSRLFYIEI